MPPAVQKKLKIGVVATASRVDPNVVDKINALAASVYPENTPEIYFHPNGFLSHGHFAGSDQDRARAFLDIANDATFDALWFARGGYGSGRLAELVFPALRRTARRKTYLGYSDAGVLLAGLYAADFGEVAHGPMPHDILRQGGEAAVVRALRWLVERDPASLEPSVSTTAPSAAFNMTVFSQLIGTPWQPELDGHVLMLEEVSEYMYRIDRSLFHITSNRRLRRLAGIRLGRCSDIPGNDPDFAMTEEEVVAFWCDRSGIPYLGRADIGHDVANKVVPFGVPGEWA
jgi:muramoyltetrapeptide carboxypeptidase